MSPASIERTPFIVVAGNIATGKTSLVQRLASALKAVPLKEDVKANPFFERFYEEPANWAFPSQLAFALDALQRHVNALSGEAVVQDRTVYETIDIFSYHLRECGHLSADQFRVLTQLRECARGLPRQPTLLLYLHAPSHVLLDRISHRGRPAEKGITADYLAALESRYSTFVTEWDTSPVLSVDSSKEDLRQPARLERFVRQNFAGRE